MEQLTITDDEFYDTYKPLANVVDPQASWGGDMYETFGAELGYVAWVHGETPLHVWTILDCDGLLVISAGMSHVNRIGYLITEIPAPADTWIEAFDPADVEELREREAAEEAEE